MPILGTKPNPIQIAVSLIAKLPKGGREWFYAILFSVSFSFRVQRNDRSRQRKVNARLPFKAII